MCRCLAELYCSPAVGNTHWAPVHDRLQPAILVLVLLGKNQEAAAEFRAAVSACLKSMRQLGGACGGGGRGQGAGVLHKP